MRTELEPTLAVYFLNHPEHMDLTLDMHQGVLCIATQQNTSSSSEETSIQA